jgi:5-methylcytosine-specific restriction protein A
MPQRAPSACRRPGCAGLVRAGVCSRCGPLRSQVQAAHDEQRGTAAQRGYGGRWQRLRLAFLSEHPLCAHCLACGIVVPATDVHHLVPRRDGGSDEESNLQALCHACHSRVTGAGG